MKKSLAKKLQTKIRGSDSDLVIAFKLLEKLREKYPTNPSFKIIGCGDGTYSCSLTMWEGLSLKSGIGFSDTVEEAMFRAMGKVLGEREI